MPINLVVYFLCFFITGDVPLHLSIRQTSDEGKPIIISSPNSPQAEAYRHIANQVVQRLPEYVDPMPTR